MEHIQQTVIKFPDRKDRSPNVVMTEFYNPKRGVSWIGCRTILDFEVWPETCNFLDDVSDVVFDLDDFAIHGNSIPRH
jgi:hypothetical protein